MKNFQIGPIKDFIDGIYDGPHATPPEASDGPIFLGIKNVGPDGRLDFSEVKYLSEQDFPKWTRRVTPQKDDIVFSYEATLHRYALIPEGFRGCLGRRMALVRPNKAKVDPRFLHYYFLTETWRKVVEKNIINGATVDRIPITKFPDFEVKIPSLNQQIQIANVVSNYDELINNNCRRIQLLEQSARLLYKEWFVNFRFPSHEHVKIVDGVPEGWQQNTLSYLGNDIRDIVKPKQVEPDTPYIGLEHIPKKSITLMKWGKVEDIESDKLRYLPGDILFGKIRPYFHKVGFTLTDGIASSDAIVIRPTEERYYFYLLMMVSSERFVAIASKTAKEGSKMPRVDWRYMKNYNVLIPPDSILSYFNRIICPIITQLKLLAMQNRKLQEARDLLLPRLMNGEITV